MTRRELPHIPSATALLRRCSYYFGDKLGLYLACVEIITDRIQSRLSPPFTEAEDCLKADAPVPRLIDCYCTIQDSLLDSFFAPGEGDCVAALIWSRGFQINEANELMNERVAMPLYRVNAAIIGRILGRPADDLTTTLNVIGVNGLFMNYYLNWPRIAELLEMYPMHSDTIDRIKSVLRKQATNLLAASAKDSGTWPKARARRRAQV